MLGFVQSEAKRLLGVSKGLEGEIERLSHDVSEGFRRKGEKAIYDIVSKCKKLLKELETNLRGDGLSRQSCDPDADSIEFGGFESKSLQPGKSEHRKFPIQESPNYDIERNSVEATRTKNSHLNFSTSGLLGKPPKRQTIYKTRAATEPLGFFSYDNIPLNTNRLSNTQQIQPPNLVDIKYGSLEEENPYLQKNPSAKLGLQKYDSSKLIERLKDPISQNRYLNQMMDKIFGASSSKLNSRPDPFAAIRTTNRISRSLQKLQAANHKAAGSANREDSWKTDLSRHSSAKKIKIASPSDQPSAGPRFSAAEIMGSVNGPLDTNKRLLDLIAQRSDLGGLGDHTGSHQRRDLARGLKSLQPMHLTKLPLQNPLAGRMQGHLRQQYEFRKMHLPSNAGI